MNILTRRNLLSSFLALPFLSWLKPDNGFAELIENEYGGFRQVSKDQPFPKDLDASYLHAGRWGYLEGWASVAKYYYPKLNKQKLIDEVKFRINHDDKIKTISCFPGFEGKHYYVAFNYGNTYTTEFDENDPQCAGMRGVVSRTISLSDSDPSLAIPIG